MNRIERAILESFKKEREQSISELMEMTKIPRGTLKKYLPLLVEKGLLEAFAKGRSRYYVAMGGNEKPLIAVLKSSVLVGFLAYEEGQYAFEYDKSYKGLALDGLTFEQMNYATNLFTVFENLIPESDRRDSYLANKDNLAEILLELSNTHGDFDFVLADELYVYKEDYSKRQNWVLVKEKILEENHFFNILKLDIAIEKEILEEKGKHSSLSGYQNKIDVNIDFKKGLLTQSSEALYLLKPYNIQSTVYDFKNKEQMHLPFLGLNEHLFMSFAKNSYGFDVPWSAVIEGENDFHYVVKRYDRYEGFKYEQKDFAQVMGIKSDQKYFTTSEKLFDAIANVVKGKDERLKFLEFYLFSFVIEHADLHIKNISIINIGRNKFRLSPLYDLISNGLYRGDSDELGLPIAGKKRNISLEEFYNLALRLEISRLQAKKSARKIVEIFLKDFPFYIEQSSKIKAFKNLRIQKNRYTHSTFTKDLEKFYKRRVEYFRKKGFLEELGLDK